MNVCIIRPPILVPFHAFISIKTPPIGAAYVAATLRNNGHSVSIIDGLGGDIENKYKWNEDTYVFGMHLDEIVEAIPDEVDIIGFNLNFSFEWPIYRKMMELVKEKFPEALIIAGGEHANACPKHILLNSPTDVCVLGEGEETIGQIVTDYSNNALNLSETAGVGFLNEDNKFVKTKPRIRIKELDNIPRPAWDLVPMEEYLSRSYGHGTERGRSVPILASRGCPYQCTFCSNADMWTTRWNIRSPEDVIDEMKEGIKTYQAENFDFYDLTAIVKKDWIVSFCNMLIKQKLNVTWQLPSGTRSEAIDGEVARLLYLSGCRNLSYAPESGSERILTLIKKKIKLDRMLVSMRQCRKEKLILKANIIIGFPDETFSDIMKTIWFSVKMAVAGVYDYSIFVFSPYPGTELYEELEKDGKVELTDDFFDSLRTYTDVTRTYSFCKNFTGKQLNLFRFIGTAAFYTTSFIVRPYRPIKMLVNVLTDKHLESRTEKGLYSILNRLGYRH